ncbi:hypothetical protein Aperf_G00000127982 [Anoplocephala perfoliata]
MDKDGFFKGGESPKNSSQIRAHSPQNWASNGMQTDSSVDLSPSLEEEEETKYYATSHSVIITQCPGDGETKPVEREDIVEQQTTSTMTVSNAIQPCEVGNIIQGCRREKLELQQLNDRLSSFIERVRLLEAHNRTLAREASSLRSNYSSDINRLRAIYNTDLEKLKTSLSTSEANCAHNEIRANRAENELEDVKLKLRGKEDQIISDQERLRSLSDQLKVAQNEVQEIQQRCTTMAEERAREISEFKNLQERYKEVCLRNERLSVAQYATETNLRIFREEMEHRKRVQNEEMRELSALVQRESTQEAVAIFRTEIMQALREIQLEYEQRLEAAKADIHSAYMTKLRILCQTGLTGVEGGEVSDSYLHHLVDEQKRKINSLEETRAEMELTIRELRRSLQDRQQNIEVDENSFAIGSSASQAELQRLRTDFETLLGSKLGLELEIASYRHLLGREEQRLAVAQLYLFDLNLLAREESVTFCSVTPGDIAIIVLESSDFEEPRMGLALPDNKPKLYSHTRSSKGNICIIECAIDGESVTLANTGSQDEDISGMRLVRQVDNQLTNTFVIPRDTVLVGSSSQQIIKEKAIYTLRAMSQTCVSPLEFR